MMKFAARPLNSLDTGAIIRRPAGFAASAGMCRCLCCYKGTGGR